MLIKTLQSVKRLICAAICARAFYVLLALAYGAAVAGADKGSVEIAVSMLYMALAAVKH